MSLTLLLSSDKLARINRPDKDKRRCWSDPLAVTSSIDTTHAFEWLKRNCYFHWFQFERFTGWRFVCYHRRLLLSPSVCRAAPLTGWTQRGNKASWLQEIESRSLCHGVGAIYRRKKGEKGGSFLFFSSAGRFQLTAACVSDSSNRAMMIIDAFQAMNR
jgi:hypothetical protein